MDFNSVMNSDIPDTLITPLKIIGKGGSAYIIECVVNYSYGEFKRGQKLIYKHCMGFLTKEACDLFIDEAQILNKLKVNLINTGICNNFPIYYGYHNKCLFGSVSELQEILINISACIGSSRVPDILFYYVNKPELGMKLYNELRNIYSVDCLLSIRDKLKIDNFDVIAELFPLIDKSRDNYHIYEFLEEELDVECSPNIVMSKIDGFDLISVPGFMLSDGLIFELIYTNMSLIRFDGKIFRDNNLSNIMIETYPYPRIYRVQSQYYMFTEGYRLVIIDAQVTALATTPRDLLGNVIVRIPLDRKLLVDSITKAYSIEQVVSNIIPTIFADYAITATYAKEVLAAYPEIQIWSY